MSNLADFIERALLDLRSGRRLEVSGPVPGYWVVARRTPRGISVEVKAEDRGRPGPLSAGG